MQRGGSWKGVRLESPIINPDMYILCPNTANCTTWQCLFSAFYLELRQINTQMNTLLLMLNHSLTTCEILFCFGSNLLILQGEKTLSLSDIKFHP